VDVLLKHGLERGYFNEADRQAYLEAWSQPGALTGGLNYYRAARLLPPPPGTPVPETPLELDVASLTVHVPTLVIWGDSRSRAVAGESRRAGPVCARPDHPPHPRRQSLGGPSKAGAGERVHPRILTVLNRRFRREAHAIMVVWVKPVQERQAGLARAFCLSRSMPFRSAF